MNIKCPHCGTEYEVEKEDMYRHAQCEVCGNGFVVGTTANLKVNAATGHVSASASVEQAVPSSRARTNCVNGGGLSSRPASSFVAAQGKPAVSRNGRSHFGHSVGYGVLGGVVLLGGILLLVSLRHKSEPEMKTATASSRDLMSESSPSGKSLEKVFLLAIFVSLESFIQSSLILRFGNRDFQILLGHITLRFYVVKMKQLAAGILKLLQKKCGVQELLTET